MVDSVKALKTFTSFGNLESKSVLYFWKPRVPHHDHMQWHSTSFQWPLQETTTERIVEYALQNPVMAHSSAAKLSP
jgi:hypothetical protein